MKKTISLLILTIILGCNSREPKNNLINREYTDLRISIEQDYLIPLHEVFRTGASFNCGFRNQYGDTIIPVGKYSHCWTDTFKTFAIVFDEINTNSQIVAIDRNENILFDIVLFENAPDKLSEGLFRIKRNNKIGYANEKGVIAIPCQFECAIPFSNGKAEVTFDCELVKDELEHTTMESETWFFINKKGHKLK